MRRELARSIGVRKNATVDETEFWNLVETARSSAGPADEALANLLTDRSLEDLVGFQRRFDAVTNRVHRWDVWAAAYLIGGGCSDDSFADFRSGLVALGRAWFDRVVADPDELASHPLVLGAAGTDDAAEVIFDEEFGYVASTAAEDEEAFWAALSTVDDADAPDLGPGWDFDDRQEMAARLPRLTSLFLPV